MLIIIIIMIIITIIIIIIIKKLGILSNQPVSHVCPHKIEWMG